MWQPVQAGQNRMTYLDSAILNVTEWLCRSFHLCQPPRTRRLRFWFLITLAAIFTLGGAARAQEAQYPKPTELPNPYRLVEGWPTLPKSMNGGRWGEVIRVHVDAKGKDRK